MDRWKSPNSTSIAPEHVIYGQPYNTVRTRNVSLQSGPLANSVGLFRT
jgi:hypothetical protein